MTDLRKAAEMALEALEAGECFDYLDNTIAPALRQALAEQEQEPLVWMNKYGHVASFQNEEYKDPLYTAPPKKEWVGLTDDEVSNILDREIGFNSCWGPETDFARAIEAKLKEKNT